MVYKGKEETVTRRRASEMFDKSNISLQEGEKIKEGFNSKYSPLFNLKQLSSFTDESTVNTAYLSSVRSNIIEFLVFYFGVFNFNVNYTYDNIKIVIGLVSTVIAIIVCVLSMYIEFNKIYLIIFVLVAVYYVINGIYYGIEYLLEKNKLVFTNKDEKIEINVELTNQGVLNITHKDKVHKILVGDVIYESGRMDKEEFFGKLQKIFKLEKKISVKEIKEEEWEK